MNPSPNSPISDHVLHRRYRPTVCLCNHRSTDKQPEQRLTHCGSCLWYSQPIQELYIQRTWHGMGSHRTVRNRQIRRRSPDQIISRELAIQRRTISLRAQLHDPRQPIQDRQLTAEHPNHRRRHL